MRAAGRAVAVPVPPRAPRPGSAPRAPQDASPLPGAAPAPAPPSAYPPHPHAAEALTAVGVAAAASGVGAGGDGGGWEGLVGSLPPGAAVTVARLRAATYALSEAELAGEAALQVRGAGGVPGRKARRRGRNSRRTGRHTREGFRGGEAGQRGAGAGGGVPVRVA